MNPARISTVQHPVPDVAAAVRFYTETFGFAVKFTDGDRYAALDAGGATLALAAPAEDVTGGTAAASVKVAQVGPALRAVVAAGGTVLRAPEPGPHEVRAVAADPWGTAFILYGPELGPTDPADSVPADSVPADSSRRGDVDPAGGPGPHEPGDVDPAEGAGS